MEGKVVGWIGECVFAELKYELRLGKWKAMSFIYESSI